MAVALNTFQLEILKLFSNEQSEEELNEIRSLLATYLSARVTSEADKAFDEKGYTSAIFENWKQKHFLRPTKSIWLK